MIDALPYLVGVVVGLLAWWLWVRPLHLDEHERRRRAAGLRPVRELPEDRR